MSNYASSKGELALGATFLFGAHGPKVDFLNQILTNSNKLNINNLKNFRK